jgi:hypothetical protein
MACVCNDSPEGVHAYSYSSPVQAEGNHFDVMSELYD